MSGATTHGTLGLSPGAEKLIAGEQILVYTEEVVRIYPDDRREVQKSTEVFESSVKKEESGARCPRRGMMIDFEDGDDLTEPLYRYILPDRTIYQEGYRKFVMPGWEVTYLILFDQSGVIFQSRWTLEDIKKAWPHLHEALQARGSLGLGWS